MIKIAINIYQYFLLFFTSFKIYFKGFNERSFHKFKLIYFGFFIVLGTSQVNAQITSFPYVEDFEFGPGGWSIQVPNTSPVTSWQLGTPENSIINYAPSGNNAWVTNLTGDYSFNENGWVQSPVFDFSSMINPIISFYVNWNCEYMYDGAVIQSSIDSGATWQNIGIYGTDPNWFTYNFIFSNPGGQGAGWTGTVDDSWGSYGYYKLNRELVGLEGQSSVIIRFVFASDDYINDEGVAFDLVGIRDCYAGEDNNLFTCVSSSSGLLNLNSLLDENAGLDGTWTSNNGLAILENDQIDLSQITATGLYNFTYTISDFSGCFDEASIVINAQLIPNAGNDNSVSICGGLDQIDLNEYLSSDASFEGLWTALDELQIDEEHIIFPSSIQSSGTYRFEYAVTSPNCGTDVSLITLTIEKGLSAGINATYDCSSLASTAELFSALEGNPDEGGRWEPNESDASFGTAGTYRYIHDATGNCPENSAEIIFTGALPDAGPDAEYFIEIGQTNLNDIISGFAGKSAESMSVNAKKKRWQLKKNSTRQPINPDTDTGEVDFPNTGTGPEEEYIFTYIVENDCGEIDEADITIWVGGGFDVFEQGYISICAGEVLTKDDLFNALSTDWLRCIDFGTWEDENGNVIWDSFDSNINSFPVGVGEYTFTDCSFNTAKVTVTQIIPEIPNAGPDRAYYLSWGQYDLDDIINEGIIPENTITNKSLSQSKDSAVSLFRRWQFKRTNGPLPATIEDDSDVDFPNTGTGGEVEFTFIYTVENDCGETDDAEITFYLNEGNLWSLNINICTGELLNKDALFASIVSFHGGNITLFDGELIDLNFTLVNFPVGEGIYTFYPNYSGNAYDLTVTEQECFTKAFLQGSYNSNTGLMNDNLRINGLIPLQSTYSDELVIDQTILNVSGDNAIVDWIWVELRDSANNQTVISGKSALLQRNGNIVGIDGATPLVFNVPSGDYYMVVSHRNHLGVITASTYYFENGKPLGSLDLTNDFSLISGGTNAIKDMEDGSFALYAGDFNGDGQVQNTDKSAVEPLRGISGYSDADIDMNGEVQNTDLNSVLNPNLGKGKQYTGKQLFAKRKKG